MTPSHSLSAHLFAQEPLAFEHLRETARAGFRQVELWAMTPHLDLGDPGSLSRLKGWLADLAVATASFHAPFYADLAEARAGRWLSLARPDPASRRDALARTEAAMRPMADLGARVAVLHPCAPGPAGGGDTREALRESLEALLPLAERLGLTLALENIPAPLGRPAPLAGLIEALGHPRLRICLDAGHAHLTEGEAAGAAFGRLAPLAAALHLHDNDGGQDAHLLPGEGAIRWPALLEALEGAGFRGPLTYEIRRREGESYPETLAALARAAAWLSEGAASSAGRRP